MIGRYSDANLNETCYSNKEGSLEGMSLDQWCSREPHEGPKYPLCGSQLSFDKNSNIYIFCVTDFVLQ